MKRGDYVAFALLAGLNLIAIVYFGVYWFSTRNWFVQPVLFVFVTILLVIVLGNYQGRWLMLLLMKRPVLPRLRTHPRVGAATTFVPGSESFNMLECTVQSLLAMNYAHDTWVLDEGDDARVKALCTRLGVHHFTRAGLAHYQAESGTFSSKTKYGNINAWLHEHAFARYDVVALFDPDHVALPNFLDRVLGYFEDPTIGYVQAAPAYYNQKASFVARGAAEETYAYNSSIQMAAYAMGYPVIIGSHNTHRVSALREIGGLQPHDADDVLMTLVYQARGWRGVFVPEILARGLVPVDWSSYLTQQRRWARSVLDVKLRIHPRMSSSLSSTTRVMSFLHGLNYLYRSFVLFASVLLLVYTLATSIGSTVFNHLISPELAALSLVLLTCDFYRQRFYLDYRNESGLHWRVAILHLAKWPHMLMALWDVLTMRRVPYEITPKVRRESGGVGLFVPHMVVAIVVGAAWALGAWLDLPVSMEARQLAAIFIFCTLALVLSALLPVPEPFDRTLFEVAADRPLRRPQSDLK